MSCDVSARCRSGRWRDKLAVGQPAVAKLERRTDLYVGNLRRYVEALGGTLEVTARFPDGAVALDIDDRKRREASS